MKAHRQQTLTLQRPFDIEVEQQLLGALMMYNDQVDLVAGFLVAEHFAEPLHQRIYEAIISAVRSGQSATPFTLKNEFQDDAAMAELGGPTYLASLAAYAKDCISSVNWAKVIHSLAFRRRLIIAARDIQDAAQNASVEYGPEKIAEYAERLITETAGASSPASCERFRAVGDVAKEVLEQITGPNGEPTVSFGLRALDGATGGMRPKELIIIGARPGMGKTAVAAHLATMAARQGHGVGFFSMEMSAPAITLRMCTAAALEDGRTVAYEAARRRDLNADDQDALFKAEGWLRQLPLKIHEGRGLTPTGILLAAKRLQNGFNDTQTPLGLVIVDHIQKIKPDRDMRGNKVAEMTEISDALQKMAGQLNIPIIALSQLNRLVESRNDKRPELSDLRESGSIEQDADMVLLLHREAYYHKKKEPPQHSHDHADWYAKWVTIRNRLDIHLAKQRNGPEGMFTVHFDAPTSALKD